VDFTAGLDTEARGKVLCLRRGSNPGIPFCSQALHWEMYASYGKSLYTSELLHPLNFCFKLTDINGYTSENF
jgi:hypothetical protein